MSEKNQDFEFHAGNTVDIPVDIDKTDGTAKSLSGASASWAMWEPSSPGNVIEKTTSGGGVSITDASGGEVTVSLTPSDSSGLGGRYRHELVVEDSSGNMVTTTMGSVTVYEKHASL